ncbi:MAG: methionine aminopeptidase type [Solirubrobacterales bacterium]|nr:methionine aminopeptidase type [Solirubrobacterales bacterium]
MSIDTPEELAAMRRVGALVAHTLRVLRAAVRPGITTGALDELAQKEFARAGASSGPADLVGFPGCICISVNEEVVHGVPGARVLREGDLVSLDVTPLLDGFCADAAITVHVGRPRAEAVRLLGVADECLRAAVRAAVPGAALNTIGGATERVADRAGVSVYEELTGHGVGRSMHEEPTVPNVFVPRLRRKLQDGLVLAIEPMIGLGSDELELRDDGWTIATADGSLSAHVEHTVVVRRGGGQILTSAA